MNSNSKVFMVPSSLFPARLLVRRKVVRSALLPCPISSQVRRSITSASRNPYFERPTQPVSSRSDRSRASNHQNSRRTGMPKGKKKTPPVPESSLRIPTVYDPSQSKLPGILDSSTKKVSSWGLDGEEQTSEQSHSKETREPVPVVDTHCHILSTFSSYRQKYPDGQHLVLSDFVSNIVGPRSSDADLDPEEGSGSDGKIRTKVEGIIDVWCEAPIMKEWKEVADQALEMGRQVGEGVNYNFVIGVHPHNASSYNPSTHSTLQSAQSHPLCVGWGEIGLDYHYDNSPREVQQDVLRQQLRGALEVWRRDGKGKAITIHTREADKDIWRILKEEVPKEQKLHIHCYTDSVELATRLLDHFPNLYIGITGVITFSTNLNTANVVRLFKDVEPPSSYPSPPIDGELQSPPSKLRLLLETDSPYMVPSNLPPQPLGLKSNQKMPFSHSGMIPWTAEFVANVLNEQRAKQGIATDGGEGGKWDVEKILRVCRGNAKWVYGV